MVVTSIADPFNGEVVAGIEEVANREGYSVVLATSQADPRRELAVVHSFRERRVDGILVASSRLGAQYQSVFTELEAPIVLLNNQHASELAHSVSIDKLAMQLLIAILRGQAAERKVVVRGELVVRGSTGKPVWN